MHPEPRTAFSVLNIWILVISFCFGFRNSNFYLSVFISVRPWLFFYYTKAYVIQLPGKSPGPLAEVTHCLRVAPDT